MVERTVHTRKVESSTLSLATFSTVLNLEQKWRALKTEVFRAAISYLSFKFPTKNSKSLKPSGFRTATVVSFYLIKQAYVV